MKSLSIPVVLLLAAMMLAACNREGSGGPAEKAGRAVDRATEKAGQAVEKAGRDMQDAAKGDKK
jgi:predicted small secreted protein